MEKVWRVREKGWWDFKNCNGFESLILKTRSVNEKKAVEVKIEM